MRLGEEEALTAQIFPGIKQVLLLLCHMSKTKSVWPACTPRTRRTLSLSLRTAMGVSCLETLCLVHKSQVGPKEGNNGLKGKQKHTPSSGCALPAVIKHHSRVTVKLGQYCSIQRQE